MYVRTISGKSEEKLVRKRIKQLARGKFEYAKPLLSISEEEIALTVIEGEDYEGSFTISSEDAVKLRGIV